MRFDPGSLFSGALGALLCTGSALALPAFKTMFDEVGDTLPGLTAFVVGVPSWGWWLLSVLSLLLMALKDRWIRGPLRSGLNAFYVALTFAAGLGIVIGLFLPLIGLTERL